MNMTTYILLAGLMATASLAVAEKKPYKRPKPNYDEDKVPEYTLPDPLVLQNGTAVKDAATWRDKRRPEVLELFRKYMYGRTPVGRPAAMTFEILEEDAKALGGLATRRQVAIRPTGKTDGPTLELLLYLPNKGSGPAPAFLTLNFMGNHSIHPDPAIRLTGSWLRGGKKATDDSRGERHSRWPVEKIVKRGYALATIYYGDIDPDYHDGFKNGVHAAFDARDEDGTRPPDAWASIATWAWGLSRAMDYLETDKHIDGKRVIVMGHSRLGKTALWAGAEDERFAIVISNNSGCGGAALSRRCFGETVGVINHSFPHWFCENFKQYNGNEGALPLDQHMLIALVSPRPVYVASAEGDRWADPRGEFLSCLHANPVCKLLGTAGLPATEMPAVDKPVHGTIGYHVRTGKHDVTDFDWKQYMDFADKAWAR